MARAIWLASVLRAEGLSVVEEEGWEGRGGDFTAIRGVILHHTASNPKGGDTPALATVRDGRPGLPGPLSQLLLSRDGTFHVIADGRSNHAGPGKWHGITAGNSSFIGIEAENDGIGEKWSARQMVAYVRGVAAILKHIHADPIMAVGHKEWAQPQGRKIDPTFDMEDFRDGLEELMGLADKGSAPLPRTVPPVRAMLRKGMMDNASVKMLQMALGLPSDGDFGPKTEAAVKSFQSRKGLKADGKVGPKTWATLLGE